MVAAGPLFHASGNLVRTLLSSCAQSDKRQRRLDALLQLDPVFGSAE